MAETVIAVGLNADCHVVGLLAMTDISARVPRLRRRLLRFASAFDAARDVILVGTLCRLGWRVAGVMDTGEVGYFSFPAGQIAQFELAEVGVAAGAGEELH